MSILLAPEFSIPKLFQGVDCVILWGYLMYSEPKLHILVDADIVEKKKAAWRRYVMRLENKRMHVTRLQVAHHKFDVNKLQDTDCRWVKEKENDHYRKMPDIIFPKGKSIMGACVVTTRPCFNDHNDKELPVYKRIKDNNRWPYLDAVGPFKRSSCSQKHSNRLVLLSPSKQLFKGSITPCKFIMTDWIIQVRPYRPG